MFLHARQIIRRRLKEAALKAKAGAIEALETVPEVADHELEQLAADEVAALERVRAHFKARTEARQAELIAEREQLAASIARIDPPL
jgi:hypothetical protein